MYAVSILAEEEELLINIRRNIRAKKLLEVLAQNVKVLGTISCKRSNNRLFKIYRSING